MPPVPKPAAIKYLARQLKQLHTQPIPGVVAEPVDGDLTRWHGTIFFPGDHEHFPAMPVHFELRLVRDVGGNPFFFGAFISP